MKRIFSKIIAVFIMCACVFSCTVTNQNVISSSTIKLNGTDTDIDKRLNIDGCFEHYDSVTKRHNLIYFFGNGSIVEGIAWGQEDLSSFQPEKGMGVYEMHGDTITAELYYDNEDGSTFIFNQRIVQVKYLIIDKNTIAEIGFYRPLTGQKKDYWFMYHFRSDHKYSSNDINRFLKNQWLWKSEADRQAWLQRQKE